MSLHLGIESKWAKSFKFLLKQITNKANKSLLIKILSYTI